MRLIQLYLYLIHGHQRKNQEDETVNGFVT